MVTAKIATPIIEMQTAARHYLLIVGIAVAGLALILRAGSHLPAPAAPLPILNASQTVGSETQTPVVPLGQAVKQRLEQNAADPLSRFFLQLFFVITVSYGVGWLFTRCGQPAGGRRNDGRCPARTVALWVARAQCISVCLHCFIPRRLSPPEPGGCLPFYVCRRHGNGLGAICGKKAPRPSSLATPVLPFPVFSAPDLRTCFTGGWPNPAPLLSPSPSSLPSR